MFTLIMLCDSYLITAEIVTTYAIVRSLSRLHTDDAELIPEWTRSLEQLRNRRYGLLAWRGLLSLLRASL
jgi:hypothetical protein